MALFGKKEKSELTLPEKLPEHVGFIMDGNGRWAKKRGLPRPFGHREGAKQFKKIVRYCKDIGLKNISFYAFCGLVIDVVKNVFYAPCQSYLLV